MQAITHLDRKSLIRLMKGSLERKPRRQQRGKSYGPEVDDALRVIAESLDHVCAERLTPNLVWMAGATWRQAGPGARIMPELALHLQLEGLSRLGSNRAGGRAASRSRFIGEGFTGNQKAHG
jgi:hypothetical protein